jgi:hypothetical protein
VNSDELTARIERLEKANRRTMLIAIGFGIALAIVATQNAVAASAPARYRQQNSSW